MTRLVLLVALSLAGGCADDAGVDTDVDLDTEADTDADTEARLLAGGLYDAAPPEYSNNTCGTLFDGLYLLPVNLVWVEEDAFDLRYDPQYGVSDTACEVHGDDSVTCGGYTQDIDQGTLRLLFDVDVDAFRRNSRTSFELDWATTLDCEGDCADDVTFPCTIDTLARFTAASQ